MAIVQRNVVLTSKDAAGNTTIDFPATSIENVEGGLSQEEIQALIDSSNQSSTVEDLGTFQGTSLSTLITALDTWLETYKEKSTHCRFFAPAQGITNGWAGNSLNFNVALTGSVTPWSAQILATLNGGNIIQLLLTNTGSMFIATRNGSTWQKLYQIGTVTGTAASASKLATARKIILEGDVTGNVSFDGSKNAIIETTLANPIPFMNISMEAWEDYTADDLGYETYGVPTGGWDGVQGYRINLSSLVDEDGYMPSYVQVICPINSQGKALIALTLAIEETEGEYGTTYENYIYEGFNREIAIPAIEAPLLHFPAFNPYLFVSGMAVFEDEDLFFENVIIRVWYGGLC